MHRDHRSPPTFGDEPSPEIRSSAYDSVGNTLDYVCEMDGDTLTIWGGEKGSSSYHGGTFSADGTPGSLPGAYEQAFFGGRPSWRTAPRMFAWIREDPEALVVVGLVR